MYRFLLFDLDGTIVDSKPGIEKCLVYAFEKIGVEAPDNLNDFIGPPLHVSMKEKGFSDDATRQFIQAYRERYTDQGVFENTLFPFVKETLTSLYEKGKKLILATSKPQVFAKKILEIHSIDKLFHKISAATLDGKLSDKNDIVRNAAQGLDLKETIMTGDRKYDIIAAKKNSMASIGVLYGYAEKNELENCGADFTVNDFRQISDIVSH